MTEPQKRLPRTPLVFRLRLAKLTRELEEALVAAYPRWEKIDRDRALAAAAALESDARAHGLEALVILARSMVALLKLPQDQIMSISIPFKEAVWDVLHMIKARSDGVLFEAG